MPIEVRLEQTSMGMQEGTVLEWFKGPGDAVEADEVIGEVETEKSVIEIAAPSAGTLASILVQAGEAVPPRTLLAVIAAPGENVDKVREGVQDAAGDVPAPLPPDSRPQPAGTPVEAAPAARRLAKESGLDLVSVLGTGPGGRITEDDVRRALATSEDKSTGASGVAESIPLTGVRGRVAERMYASLQTSAQFTLTAQADVTDLVRRRDAVKTTLPVTYTHLIIRACALALREHPRLNAVVSEDAIQVLSSINIGIAVALEEGLIVPVLRNADELDLEQIIAHSTTIIDKAQARRATRDDLSGGTFTVSNLGAYGIDSFTPILDAPEVAILGVGRVKHRPIPNGADGVMWRNTMTLCLTVDHRAVDGVPAAQFLQTVVRHLEAPERLFGSGNRRTSR